jgi:hypothetical protein
MWSARLDIPTLRTISLDGDAVQCILLLNSLVLPQSANITWRSSLPNFILGAISTETDHSSHQFLDFPHE